MMRTKPTTVLLLDIDGVLNRCALSGQGLESDKVTRLAHIIRETGAGIVVSSEWRRTEHQRERLAKLFYQIEAVFCGWTPILDKAEHSGIYTAPGRGEEIQVWLDAHPDVRHFVIVDDSPDLGHLAGHLVQTASSVGLTDAIADELIRRLREVPPWEVSRRPITLPNS